jgi:dolichyl-phosphate-mannose-protein mannosyltransferase
MSFLSTVRRTSESKALLTGAKILVGVLLGYFVGAFLYIAIARMNYHFTLEWLEGGSLIQVQRLLFGQPLYAEPSFDYVAQIYSPVYYYVAYLLSRIMGFGFLPLRLVSFLSTLGCVGLIYLLMRKHSANAYVSIMAAGSFLALYKVSDTWFDLARVDMLAFFLALLAIYLMQSGSTLNFVLAGVALSLACLTKQTFWIIVPPVLAYGFFVHGMRAWVLVLTTFLVSGLSHLLLDRIYQGWYSFFVYDVGFRQGGSVFAGGIRHFFAGYWLDAVLRNVPIFFLMFGIYFIARRRQHRAVLGLLALASGMILLSWLGILNKGGYNNVLIPSYTIFLIYAWLLVGELLNSAATSNLLRTGLLLLYSIQLIYLLYPIAPQIPTAQDLAAGRSLVQDLQHQPGDVYLPFDNYLALYAGKKPFAGIGALGDLNEVRAGPGRPAWNSINSILREMIRNRSFSLIILDENAEWGSAEHYYQSYYQPSPISYSQDAFFPVAGWQIRPKIRYTPVGSN